MVDRPNKPSAISPVTNAPQPIVDISQDSSRVTARLPTGESVEILLYGATVISWKNSNGSENLWLSDKAALDSSKPVRGGIPIVFPNFGPPPKDHATSSLAQHGFARNNRWEYLGKSTTESGPLSKSGTGDDTVKLDFGLYSKALPADVREKWPYDFGLVYSVSLGRESLQTFINVRNEGTKPFEFQTLLHTYLRVNDITKVGVTGLVGTEYVDKMLNATTHTESNQEIKIAGEVDRVYKSIKQSTTSVVESGKPRFDIVRDRVEDTVVWNPWKEKANGMGDFEPKDGYHKMICVEVGTVQEFTKLDGGESWEGGQTMKSLI